MFELYCTFPGDCECDSKRMSKIIQHLLKYLEYRDLLFLAHSLRMAACDPRVTGSRHVTDANSNNTKLLGLTSM